MVGIILCAWSGVRFYPPGGTPRLYGRQDARRYGICAAQAAAYAALEAIQFEGAHFSCDIAAKGANLLGCAETYPSFDSRFVS